MPGWVSFQSATLGQFCTGSDIGDANVLSGGRKASCMRPMYFPFGLPLLSIGHVPYLRRFTFFAAWNC